MHGVFQEISALWMYLLKKHSPQNKLGVLFANIDIPLKINGDPNSKHSMHLYLHFNEPLSLIYLNRHLV